MQHSVSLVDGTASSPETIVEKPVEQMGSFRRSRECSAAGGKAESRAVSRSQVRPSVSVSVSETENKVVSQCRPSEVD